jgi:probable HAF family extracellular repeat protein
MRFTCVLTREMSMPSGVQIRRLVWAAGMWMAAVPVLASPLFKLTDLGAPGGEGRSLAIDAHGTVCGTSIGTQGGVVPTIFDHGKVTVLIPFPGSRDQGGACTGINALGSAAGEGYDENGNSRGFVWDGRTYTIIPQLSGNYTVVLGMNAKGDVVGGSALASDLIHAFLFRNGKMVDLGATIEGGDSQAAAVNSTGEVTGYADSPGASAHAMFDRNGRMKDLGDLGGGANSQGWAINDKGQIAALVWPTLEAPYSVITYKGKVEVIPGSTHTMPVGINGGGHVVGDALGSIAPWFYDGKKLYSLQSIIKGAAGWQLQSAAAVNDDDSIAATAISPADGSDHAVLLTRVR